MIATVSLVIVRHHTVTEFFLVMKTSKVYYSLSDFQTCDRIVSYGRHAVLYSPVTFCNWKSVPFDAPHPLLKAFLKVF